MNELSSKNTYNTNLKTMKNLILYIALLLAFSLNSCMDEYTEEFLGNSPLYLSYEDLRSSIQVSEARELKEVGKIYFKDDFIFVNERLKGVHVINNQDPANPINIGFIEIPGNSDIAIKNNTLYADSYVDMVAIDISDRLNPVEADRIEDVFPYSVAPVEDESLRIAEIDEDKGIVVGWEVKKITRKIDNHRIYPIYYVYEMRNVALDAGMPVPSYSGGGGNVASYGVGGSMARFGLYEDHLYAVDHSNLYIFDTSGDNLKHEGNQQLGWQIETMFLYDEHMFLGTMNGMLIYSLEVPTSLTFKDEYRHITSCDPVVVADGYAYVTLRGGNRCGSNVNRLDIIELSDNYIDNKMIASYPLHGPYGLGIDGQILFVCDGDAGLKIYDVEDKTLVDQKLIKQFQNINAFDVIPLGNYLFMIGEDGFYQYDYSDLNDIRQISFIPVIKGGGE